MKKLFWFLEMPTRICGSSQRIFLFQVGEEKKAIVECPAEKGYFSFEYEPVEEKIKEYSVIPQEPKDEKSFDKIWDCLSEGEEIDFELMTMFLINHNLVEITQA
jgi:hypothetical protein